MLQARQRPASLNFRMQMGSHRSDDIRVNLPVNTESGAMIVVLPVDWVPIEPPAGV